MMKKHIWRLLQITLLVLVVSTIHDSILALNSNNNYCSGMWCESDNDCAIPCFCSLLENRCYNTTEPRT
jgi:hypothetical protein